MMFPVLFVTAKYVLVGAGYAGRSAWVNLNVTAHDLRPAVWVWADGTAL